MFPSFDREIILLSDGDRAEVKAAMKKEAGMLYLDAKRSLTSSSQSIPIWIIILLFILGWNEFVMIISSPFYLFIALLIISMIFTVHHLNLSGPILAVFNLFINLLTTPIGSSEKKDVLAKKD